MSQKIADNIVTEVIGIIKFGILKFGCSDPNPTLPHTIVANGWQTVKFFADVGEAMVNLPIAEGKW